MTSTQFDRPFDPGSAAADLAQNGFEVFRNVLPNEQIISLRSSLHAHFSRTGRYSYGGKTERRGMHAVKEVAEIVTNARMLELMRACAHPHPPVLTGECFLAMNTLAEWHKDITRGMGLGNGIFDDPEFRVYKIAVYLQDQEAHAPEVFKVKPGSAYATRGDRHCRSTAFGSRR